MADFSTGAFIYLKYGMKISLDIDKEHAFDEEFS